MTEFGTTGLGDTLRAERLRQGMELATIAAETRIRCNILDAIERNRFDRIPGGSYRRSFLRQYALALRLDEGEVMAAFRQQYTEPLLPLPVPLKEPRSTRFREVCCMLAAVAAIAIAYRVTESGQSPEVKTAAVAQFIAAAAPAGVPTGVPTGVPAASLAERPAPPPVVAGSSAPGLVRVAFTATEPVWVSVKCDGTLRYSGTLEGQEARTFEASRVVTVLIGNAGGLTISLDGKPIGPLGQHGQTQLLEITTGGARRLPLRPPPSPDTASELEA